MKRALLRSALALALLVACKGSSPADPAEVKKLTADYVAALQKCDRAALDAIVDMKAIAKKIGDAHFGELAAKEWSGSLACENKAIRWAATGSGIRREQSTLSGVERVAYFMLIAEGKPAKVVDVASPLLTDTIGERLKWNWKEPVGDHPGRIGDTMYFPFEGVPAASFVLLSGAEANVNAKPPDDKELGQRIVYGTESWNALAVEKAVAAVEAKIGRDPYLQDLVAAVHRTEPKRMLEIARAVTKDSPDIPDALVTQLYAEVLAEDYSAALTTLDTLVTKHQFDPRVLGKSLALARFTASPAFVQKYRL